MLNATDELTTDWEDATPLTPPRPTCVRARHRGIRVEAEVSVNGYGSWRAFFTLAGIHCVANGSDYSAKSSLAEMKARSREAVDRLVDLGAEPWT